MHTRGQQAGAVSPANPGSSAYAGDYVAFQATNVASPGIKSGSALAFQGDLDSWTDVTKLSGYSNGLKHMFESNEHAKISFVTMPPAGVLPAAVPLAEDLSAGVPHEKDPEKSFRNGTQVGVSTYPLDPLNIRTEMDESADEHHTRYGVAPVFKGITVYLVPLVPGQVYQLCSRALTKVPHIYLIVLGIFSKRVIYQ